MTLNRLGPPGDRIVAVADPDPNRADADADADADGDVDVEPPPEVGTAAAPDPELGAAASRLHAWRAQVAPVGLPGGPLVGRAADGPVEPAADELVERLRARRSARHVAAAYAAAHGHPVVAGFSGHGTEDHGTAGGRRRWALGLRTAVVASVAVLLIGVGAAVVASHRSDGVVTLAGVEATPDARATVLGAEDGAKPEAGTSGPAPSDPGPSTAPSAAVPVVGAARVVVHVVGEVRKPGLVTLAEGARVADAVEAAGGATRNADTASLNLARAVLDGEQIVVLRPGEVPSSGSGDSSAGSAGTGAPGGAVLDLNTAGAGELDTLPGIGPVLAERVVAWRDENGAFTSIEELEEVSGIGPSVLESIRDLVRV